MSNQVTVVAFVCSLVLVATASMPPTLSELLLSTSTDQPDACCTHKCCFEFNGGCCAASCCTDCNPPATCCKGKCSAPSPPPPPGPKPPPPTPPPPAPLPCTITPTPPLGNGSRMASWWYYDTYTPSAISKMLAILKREGGNKAVTSIILDCGDLITPNGTFVRGINLGCDQMIPALRAMGIGSERVMGGTLAGLQAAFKDPDQSINAMVALAKELDLFGFTSDYELKAAKSDAQDFTCYLAKLRLALNKIGTRLTIFTDNFDGLIDDYPDLQHGVDRLLDGDTYWYASRRHHNPPPTDAQNMSGWLTSYHGMANANIERSKVGPAMLAATDGGLWNCKNSSMAERMAQLKTDNISEVNIFRLNIYEPGCNDGTSFQCPGPTSNTSGGTNPGHHNTDGQPSCMCSQDWFQFTREFLAGN